MKIVICGSVNFAEKIREVEKGLKDRGHDVVMPHSITEHNLNSYEDARKLKEDGTFAENKPDLTRRHFDEIKNSDAILVVNQEKNGIPNYIGGATFAEMVFASYLGKRVFLLNPIPTDEKLSMLRDEIEAVKPRIINSSLEEIA